MQIRGIIKLPTGIKRSEGRFYIRIQDTSMMDAPAETIAETEMKFSAGKAEMTFKIDVEHEVDPRSSYTLFVHLDLDQDKQLSSGDWINRQSYPVIVNGQPVKNLEIALREID